MGAFIIFLYVTGLCVTGFVGNTLVISVLYYGGLLVSRGEITVGQLSSFMLYVVFTGASVSGLSNFYSELMKGEFFNVSNHRGYKLKLFLRLVT